MELVDGDMKWRPIATAKRGEMEAHDQQGAKQPALPYPQFSLRKIGDEHLSVREDVVDVKPAPGVARRCCAAGSH